MKRLLLTAAAVIGLCGTAAAWDGPYFSWAGGCGYPYFNIYARETIPYYAEHPPVYYSHAVARPYGYSPYAYPPTVLTPGTKLPEPHVVQNAYVGGEVATAAPRREPLRITNPYVNAEK